MTDSELFRLHTINSLKTAKKSIARALKTLAKGKEDVEDVLNSLEADMFVNVNHIYNTFPLSTPDSLADESLSTSKVADFLPPPSKSLCLKGLRETYEHLAKGTLKCIVIGQDPYPTKGKATGRAFEIFSSSSPLDAKTHKKYYSNTSVDFIYRQLESEGRLVPTDIQSRGNFDVFVENGVVFLNTILTTVVGKVKAHSKIGWKEWMILVVRDILERYKDSTLVDSSRGRSSLVREPQEKKLVFLLWGNDSQKFMKKVLKGKDYKVYTDSDLADEDKPKFYVQNIFTCRRGKESCNPLFHIVGNCHPSPLNRKLIKQNWDGSDMFRVCETLAGDILWRGVPE
jgi:uracil DNA glycosylase